MVLLLNPHPHGTIGSVTLLLLVAVAVLSVLGSFPCCYGEELNQLPAKSSSTTFLTQLLQHAVPMDESLPRHLANNNNNNNNYNNYNADIDLTAYSLRFEKCQFVKAYDQNLADAGASTVLATQRFVLFRLCPSGSCTKCNSKYGEYMIDMSTYLSTAVDYRKQEQEDMCTACQQNCQYYSNQNNYYNNDNARRLAASSSYSSTDCASCTSACNKIQNMEANYYLDATNFINCQKISDNYNGYGAALYAGPICASQGSKIKIGVFTDADCMFLDASKDVESYLADENGNGMKLSHALLKTTYDTTDCIRCTESVSDGNGYYTSQTKQVCGTLYSSSAKCESKHGFAALTSNQYYNANNQVENESLVCDLISSLKSGTYSQEGEIVVGGSRLYSSGSSSTTGGQKFALTFFIIGTVGLAVYAAMLHSQLIRGGRANLASQGGAMA